MERKDNDILLRRIVQIGILFVIASVVLSFLWYAFSAWFYYFIADNVFTFLKDVL